jgi:hypothetical protein
MSKEALTSSSSPQTSSSRPVSGTPGSDSRVAVGLNGPSCPACSQPLHAAARGWLCWQCELLVTPPCFEIRDA